MSERIAPPGLTNGNVNWIRGKLDLITDLPKPGVTWTINDIVTSPNQFDSVSSNFDQTVTPLIRKAVENQVVRKVDRKQKHGRLRWRYEVIEDTYEWAQALHDGVASFPCGHVSGFETVTVDETYACGYEYCEQTYERETVAAVNL